MHLFLQRTYFLLLNCKSLCNPFLSLHTDIAKLPYQCILSDDNILKLLKEVVVNDIQARVGDDVVIPENKKLTCSIGISECKDNKHVSEALSRADKALYQVKKSTKNSFVVWEE